MARIDIPDGMVFEYKPKLASVEMTRTELIKCKHCKYYLEDVFTEACPGIPIITGHEACTKWGNGYMKTDPEGWCFLAEKEADNGNT